MVNKEVFFVGIGAQKAGTTWLADYLENHEQVYFSPMKELHYFNRNVTKEKLLLKKLKDSITKIGGINDLQKGLTDLEELQLIFDRLKMIGDPEEYMNYFYNRKGNSSCFGEITPAYSALNREQFGHIASLHPNTKFIFILRNPVDRSWSAHNYEKSDLHFLTRFEEKAFLKRSDYARTIRELESVIHKNKFIFVFMNSYFLYRQLKRSVSF